MIDYQSILASFPKNREESLRAIKRYSMTEVFFYRSSLWHHSLRVAFMVDALSEIAKELLPGFDTKKAFVLALVEMKLRTEGREYQIGPYRVPSHLHPFAKSAIKKTATTFDFLEGDYGSHKNNTEIVLDVLVRADIKNRHISMPFTKNYRFNESNKEWDETTWSFPDMPFPG